jgi:hypothetical protein
MTNLSAAAVNSSEFFHTVDNFIGGTFPDNYTLTLAGSPYVALGLYVPSGVQLTIEAGVQCRFLSHSSLVVDGTLTALGNDSNWIVFSGNNSSAQPGSWGSVQFPQLRNTYYSYYYDDQTVLCQAYKTCAMCTYDGSGCSWCSTTQSCDVYWQSNCTVNDTIDDYDVCVYGPYPEALNDDYSVFTDCLNCSRAGGAWCDSTQQCQDGSHSELCPESLIYYDCPGHCAAFNNCVDCMQIGLDDYDCLWDSTALQCIDVPSDYNYPTDDDAALVCGQEYCSNYNTCLSCATSRWPYRYEFCGWCPSTGTCVAINRNASAATCADGSAPFNEEMCSFEINGVAKSALSHVRFEYGGNPSFFDSRQLLLSNCYIDLDNVHVQYSYGDGMVFAGQYCSIEVDNLEANGNQQNGVSFNGGAFVTLLNGHVHDNQQAGLRVRSALGFVAVSSFNMTEH